MSLDDWFLSAEERGNDASDIDNHPPIRQAWTEGNEVRALIDGTSYFSNLVAAFSTLEEGDEVRFADWRGDGDERLADDGPTARELISQTSRRGVDVRGLLWRSHSDRLAFSAKENRRFAREVSAAGGEAVLDDRVRRGGSHHQKLVLVRHPSAPDDDVAFVGGIDLSHGRRDDHDHHGDEQSVKMNPRYGPRPPWHDVQLEVRGPAIGDLDLTFRERWEDPTPLLRSGLAQSWMSHLLKRDRVVRGLPSRLPPPAPRGGHAVQVLRTYPVRRPRYPFAPEGERSVARAFAKAVGRARSLIYIEDQYLWSMEAARILAAALRRQPDLQLIAVVPRYPDKDGRLSGPPSRYAQSRVLALLKEAGGDRVGVFDLANAVHQPIYVHAKVCIIDDVWASVGSDNLNRRSWTHDSELSCAIIDSERDSRAPIDPGGLGDGSRRFARDLRLTLWAEHLDRSTDDPELLALKGSVGLWNESAGRSEPDDVSTTGVRGGAPRLGAHGVEPVRGWTRWWARIVYRLIFDPDGRPLSLRLRNQF